MEQLKRMLRRKAGQVALEPVGSSVRLTQEESGPSVPAGGEEASGQAKWRSSLTFWRKRKTPAPLAGPEAPSDPKWRWPRVMLCRRDPGEGRSRARWLCGFLSRKQRSQEPSPRAQQEPSTSLATEETPASPEQELGGSGTGTSSSAYSQGASTSSVGSDSPEAEGSLCAETPSAQQEWAEEEEEEEWVEEEEEEEKEEVSPEQDTIRVIQEHLQGRAEVQKSYSCGAPESALPLLPSPPTQGGLVPENPSPPMGGTSPLLPGTPKWGHLSHAGQGVRSPQTLSQLQPQSVQGDTGFGKRSGFPCPTPWGS
ncbi:coiled-coil domain-containing protein 9-like isoform X1 [Mauremys mutica]|uniref:coiled-coil domain-containing protein 9-like isoform X1 n=1 Tax=Mauremys mutica TaxID=74926 RepID=UPI001D167DE9|nr:coiled-coil domain-containing protein 9-like isoform X1 [Mauremys mutica]XP_044868794.1 coiled-coil domain-containing protein 9-like isoform X1 [Mauremys mutica]XP_044868795.1 coiled-coil domain-containing protein 9-like isoform X1 [Mauremys mutica]XP_044868796.1 coiled-coil domain-containing protein 9-like isoform X1 [Mauremys mutica]